MSMYSSCVSKTWRVQVRHSRVGLVSVVLSPLLAILVLYLAQLSLYKTTQLDRYTCGCKCVRREEFGCVEYDEGTCGLMYSSAEQAPFCEVTQPPLWPAVLQVPAGAGSEAQILYTGDDMELAAGVMERLLVAGEEVGRRAASAYVRSMVLDDLEDMDAYDEEDVEAYYEEYDVGDFLDTTGALTKGLYDFGVVLGTSADRGDLVHHQMLVDRAFAPNQGELYILVADGGNRVDGGNRADGVDGAQVGGNGSTATPGVIEAIAGSIGNLTNKHVKPLFTVYRPCQSLSVMRRYLWSAPSGEGGMAGAVPVVDGAASQDITDKRETTEALTNKTGGGDKEGPTNSPVAPVPVTLAGIDWRDSGPSNGLRVDIYVDAQTAQSSRVNFRWAQSVNLAFNAYLRRFNETTITLAGVKDMPRPRSELRIDFSILLGPLLTVWIMHVILPVELYYLVYEKERSLRVYQYLNGLRPAVYLSATWSTHLLIYLLIMGAFVGLGYAFGIKMMVLNSFSLQLVFWLLWGSVITSFGFLISRLFKQKRSVVLLSLFYTLAIGFVANVVLVVLIEKGMSGLVVALQSLIPSFCAFRGLYELSSYAFLADQTNGPGLRWSVLPSDPGMLVVLLQLAAQAVVIPLLALYLERDWLFFYGNRNQETAGSGTKSEEKRQQTGMKSDERKINSSKQTKDDALDHYLGYLGGGAGFDDHRDTSVERSPGQVTRRDSSMGYYYFGGGSGAGLVPSGRLEPSSSRPGTDGGDVREESDAISGPAGPSVVYQGVKKVQPPPMSDISVPCLAIHDREVFCFLAGDQICASTLLKMIHGLSSLDEGTILVRGEDCQSLVGAHRTRIATVFDGDILFEELTGMEHLEYYVRTRLGEVGRAAVDGYIQNAIDLLELHSTIRKNVSTYSSGMRRRLSLAISLLGYPDRASLPEVLLMHEPTRSMDPYSRKVLWRALGDLRQKTTVVIATTSISEAELCDRIAIMKDGTPIFVGSPQHLIFKRGRFMFLSFTLGTVDETARSVGKPGNTSTAGHPRPTVAISPSNKNANEVIRFVKQHIQGAELLHNWGGGKGHRKLKFKIPLISNDPDGALDNDPQTIDTVFRTIERARAANTLEILDYRVENCNLEDVYLDLVCISSP